MQRVIDNKKIDLTDHEFDLYQKIVQSYTTPTNKGEDFFTDLFETNQDGVIVFLKPPSKRQTSLEIYLFIVSVMVHQQLRLMQDQVDDICQQMKDKMKEIDEKLNNIKERNK